MENRENLGGENLEGREEKPKEKQIIEGLIGNNPKDVEKVLPAGLTPEMVDKVIGHDGLYHWHLKPEYIEDEEEREKYQDEKEQWP